MPKAKPKAKRQYKPIPPGRKAQTTLNDRQRRFVSHYCHSLNATAAAKAAGYSQNAAAEIGYKQMHTPHVAKAIKDQLDKMAMPVEEAMKRLGDMARGTMQPFIQTDKDGNPRLVIPENNDQAVSLLKRVKVTEHSTVGKDGDTHLTTKTEFEIHDPKDAIDKILKANGVYTETINHKSSDGSMTPKAPIDDTARIEAITRLLRPSN